MAPRAQGGGRKRPPRRARSHGALAAFLQWTHFLLWIPPCAAQMGHPCRTQPCRGRATRDGPRASASAHRLPPRVLPPTRMGPLPRPDGSCLRLPRTGCLARLKPLPRIAVSRATSWRRPLARPPSRALLTRPGAPSATAPQKGHPRTSLSPPSRTRPFRGEALLGQGTYPAAIEGHNV